MKAGAVILAAGASTRLGEPKQLVQLDPGPGARNLLERSLHLASEAGLAPIIIVLGAHHEAIVASSHLEGAVVVTNELWQQGMASTIQCGIRTLSARADHVDGVILMTCDQPAVTSAHLRSLMDSGQTTASSYAGRQGVPAFFPTKHCGALLALNGEQGARNLLRSAQAEPLEHGEIDIDTQDDLVRARALLGR